MTLRLKRGTLWRPPGYHGAPQLDRFPVRDLAALRRLLITSSSGFSSNQGPIVRHAAPGHWVPAGAGQPKGLAGAQHWRNMLPTADLRSSHYIKTGYNGAPAPVFLGFTTGIDGTPNGAQVWRFQWTEVHYDNKSQIFTSFAPPYKSRQAQLYALRLIEGTGIVETTGWDAPPALLNLTTSWQTFAVIAVAGANRYAISWRGSDNPDRPSADIAIDVTSCPPLWQLDVPYDQPVPDLPVHSDSPPGVYIDRETGTPYIHWGDGYCTAFHRPQGEILADHVLRRAPGTPITDARFLGAQPEMSSAMPTLPPTFGSNWSSAPTHGIVPGGAVELTAIANPSNGAYGQNIGDGHNYVAARMILSADFVPADNARSALAVYKPYETPDEYTDNVINWASAVVNPMGVEGTRPANTGTGTARTKRLAASGPHGRPVWQLDLWRPVNPASTWHARSYISFADNLSGRKVWFYGFWAGPRTRDEPLPDELIVVNTGTVTRLAETIQSPVLSGAQTIVTSVDMSDGYPSVETVVLQSGAWAMSILPDGKVRVTDGSTTVTSATSLPSPGVYTIGITADAFNSVLRVNDAVEAKPPVAMPSGSVLNLGPFPVVSRPKVWTRRLSNAQLMGAS